ncbi:hypothetical protein YC2023_121997 [Brassica napus]
MLVALWFWDFTERLSLGHPWSCGEFTIRWFLVRWTFSRVSWPWWFVECKDRCFPARGGRVRGLSLASDPLGPGGLSSGVLRVFADGGSSKRMAVPRTSVVAAGFLREWLRLRSFNGDGFVGWYRTCQLR